MKHFPGVDFNISIFTSHFFVAELLLKSRLSERKNPDETDWEESAADLNCERDASDFQSL